MPQDLSVVNFTTTTYCYNFLLSQVNLSVHRKVSIIKIKMRLSMQNQQIFKIVYI